MNTTIKILALFIVLSFNSCSKKEPTPVVPVTPIPTPTPVVVKEFLPDGWKTMAKFPTNGSLAGTTVSAGDKIYHGLGYGGAFGYGMVTNNWYMYDVAIGSWTEKAPFPGVGRANAIGFFLNNKIYVGMGTNYDRNSKSDTYTDFYEYDPTTNTWAKKEDFAGPGRDQPVYFSIGNKGYMGTGNIDPFTASVVKDFWEYDPSVNKWSKKASLIGEARCRAISFAVDGIGYIGGGENSNVTKLNDLFAYDPTLDTWKAVKNMPSVLARGRGIGFAGSGYVFGGYANETNSTPSSKVYKYEPKADSWSTVTELATDKDNEKGRFYPILGANNTKIYFGAGGYGAGTEPTNKLDFYEFLVK
jgi:N-acetylneuraminic acid mutarotase